MTGEINLYTKSQFNIINKNYGNKILPTHVKCSNNQGHYPKGLTLISCKVELSIVLTVLSNTLTNWPVRSRDFNPTEGGTMAEMAWALVSPSRPQVRIPAIVTDACGCPKGIGRRVS